MEAHASQQPTDTRRARGKKANTTIRKHYILDTNVLLHDPQSMFQFKEHTVWLPVEVLEELDKFKAESTTRGKNAREVHRSLNECFPTREEMDRGVDLPGRGRLHVLINGKLWFEDGKIQLHSDTQRLKLAHVIFPDLSRMDNRILASAAFLSDTQANAPTILVTKDLNMQLKARSLGLEAEDYRTDRVDDDDITRTQHNETPEEYDTFGVEGDVLQEFGSIHECHLPAMANLLPNQYVLLKDTEGARGTLAARHLGDGRFAKLRQAKIDIRGGRTLTAANLGQKFFLDALYDPAITLVTVYGKAGTGKTLLSIGSALQQTQEGIYDRMLVTRVMMPTGRDIGFLPGDIQEKMQPWVQPALDALEMLLSRPRKTEQFDKRKQSTRKTQPDTASPSAHAGGHAQKKQIRAYMPLIQSGLVEIEAITHIRGRSLPKSIFIVDEAQQLTPHEAKTLVTRMGKDSKIVMIGDLAQIDNPYVDAHTNGLVYTRSRLQGQSFMAHVNLFKGERSEMADVAANLM